MGLQIVSYLAHGLNNAIVYHNPKHIEVRHQPGEIVSMDW